MMAARPSLTVELKGLDSSDLPGPDDVPADPDNCRVETTVRVGPAGTASGDDFILYFVTPSWLARNTSEKGLRVLSHTVVISRFEWSEAERAANVLIELAAGASWEEFVRNFSRFAYWEYSEDPAPSWSEL